MPEQPLDDATAHSLVAAAAAAPSIHNTQPWRFRLDPPARTIHVHAASRYALRATDPDTRALHLSVLLTLHGLRASILHQALEWPDLRTRMTDTSPDRCAPQTLLRIGYGPAGYPTPRRHTASLLGQRDLQAATAR
ncbi:MULTISPECIES: hypothetical protein [unclassified Kitasatospora]|uniref:hypothetical protein n=1 Tax=unclassified Kitasatospora TaxID=2633591 RepID=UPI0033F5FD1A